MPAAVNLNERPSWGVDWDGPESAAAEANKLLALISPPSDSLQWLHCYYEPGYRWQRVERLIIAEMVPRAHLAGKDAFFRMMGEKNGDSLFAELEGPNPATAWYYDEVAGKILYRSGVLAPSISERQWLLWRSHRALAYPRWIVQGRHGGHKRDFSLLEKKILKFHGLPSETPYAGDLPFATVDYRVLDKLVEMDRLQKWADSRSDDWRNRRPEEVAAARDQANAEIERKIKSWLDSQIADIVTPAWGSNRVRQSA